MTDPHARVPRYRENSLLHAARGMLAVIYFSLASITALVIGVAH